MRLKKVFAGVLAAAMLVCAVAVPAFAAEEVEQENGLTSSYVQMNIPYADFYKAVGVDNASEIDAVTSATRNKPRAGKLVAGSYHVNADGTDITGVSFPVKVLTPWALKNAKQVTDADSYDITVTLKGKESTTTYTGADALFENESYAYYKLSETPAYYITAWYDLFHTKIGVKLCSMAGGGVSRNLWNFFRTAPAGTGQAVTCSTSGMGLRLK